MITSDERLIELDNLTEKLKTDYRNAEKGNNAARTRFRVGLQNLKKLAQAMLVETPPASQLK